MIAILPAEADTNLQFHAENFCAADNWSPKCRWSARKAFTRPCAREYSLWAVFSVKVIASREANLARNSDKSVAVTREIAL